MAHQGKVLKEMVRLDPREKQAIAKKMGYSREHLYLLYKYSEFDKDQLKNIAKAGFHFGVDVPKNLKPITFGEKTVKALEQKVQELEHDCEATKNDLRNLNKKFNDLVFRLMTEPKKAGKVPASQRDLFAQD